jgi:hypothetical protein
VSAPKSAESVARELIEAFRVADTHRMRSLLADDLRAYITNSKGGVDEVGAEEYVRRVAAMNLPSAQFRLTITQTVAPRPGMVIAMIEVNAARAAGRFTITPPTASLSAMAWSPNGGWSRRCQLKAMPSGPPSRTHAFCFRVECRRRLERGDGNIARTR